MNKPLLIAAAQFAPRLLQVRRSTWIGVGVGLLVLVGLLIWAAVVLMGWMWGQSQGWMDKAPEAARGALSQVEQVVPGARETLGQIVPALKPEAKPQRDVSGTDLAPVARYPGLARTDWQRWGKQITIEYEGEADYATVLDYYAKGFAAQGFVQAVQSATVTAETHKYTKGNERIGMTIAQKPKGGISVKLNLTLQ
jgi:hypothetical protein